MGSSLSHPLFHLIKNEHLSLLKIVTQSLETLSFSELNTRIKDHHSKEERLLFNLLNTKPQICEGGPMCTYFFDAQITSPPLKIAEDLTLTTPVIPEEIEVFWANKSPLRIPTSEHLALHHILQHSKTEDLQKIFNPFREILRNNVKKEEECLFHICTRLLSTSELDMIYDSWRKEHLL